MEHGEFRLVEYSHAVIVTAHEATELKPDDCMSDQC